MLLLLVRPELLLRLFPVCVYGHTYNREPPSSFTTTLPMFLPLYLQAPTHTHTTQWLSDTRRRNATRC